MDRLDIFKKDVTRFFWYIVRLGFSLPVFFLLIFSFSLQVNNSLGHPVPLCSTLLLTPTITGPDTACAGTGGHVYITDPGMTNYAWSVSAGGDISSGQGTYSITVTWNSPGPQTVSVTYTSAPVPTVKDVAVLPVLPVGVTISASSNLSCLGTQVTFTATPVNGGLFLFY